MTKPVILTGLRANNDLHLGNYLGALLPIVDMQKKYAGEYQINLFVPDLHSFTTPIDHSQLYDQTMHNLKLFVAAGLDLSNPDTYLYRQSYIPAHSELTVILNCFTGFGEMVRMTQFKDKAGIIHTTSEEGTVLSRVEGKKGTMISVGLFDYPVLMASDILLYGAKYVPVGDDQTQHVEIARDIALRFNEKFGKELLPPPVAVKKQLEFMQQNERLRIRDLAHPEKKMSKSDESGKGVIFLGDTPEVAVKKVMSATTDSVGTINYDLQNQPGVSNLLDILSALTNRPLQDVINDYQGQTQYGPLKQAVAEAVGNFLKDFQARLAAVDDGQLKQKLETSETAMNIVANSTLGAVQKAVGLRR